VFAVAGHEDDAQRRILLLEQGGELLAGHAGHDEVADEEIDLFCAFGGEFESFLAVTGFDDGVAGGDEEFAGEFANIGLIFGEENGFGAARSFGVADGGAGSVDGLIDARQINFERSSFAEFAVDPDETAALFYNSVDGG
jgi:hypothetical protein